MQEKREGNCGSSVKGKRNRITSIVLISWSNSCRNQSEKQIQQMYDCWTRESQVRC